MIKAIVRVSRCRLAGFPVFLLVLLWAGLGTARAQETAQVRFDHANEQLSAGKYEEALGTYEKILDNGYRSGSLYLNMGISYTRLDSLGKAKYYFLKAQSYPETEQEAAQALQSIEQQFSRQSAVLPQLPWERILDWMTYNYGAGTVTGLGILLLNLGVILLVGAWFVDRITRWARQSGLGLTAAGVLIVLLGFFLQYRADRYHRAVMVTREASVLQNPEAKSGLVSKAYEGYTFTVDRKRSRKEAEWFYVRMSNGQYGWISRDNLMVL